MDKKELKQITAKIYEEYGFIKKGKYYLTIKDNGCGMNKAVLSKIKEPFFTTKKRGSGLGVALIYEIIEAHSAKINYDSEYGKGTKVTLQLPLYE